MRGRGGKGARWYENKVYQKLSKSGPVQGLCDVGVDDGELDEGSPCKLQRGGEQGTRWEDDRRVLDMDGRMVAVKKYKVCGIWCE